MYGSLFIIRPFSVQPLLDVQAKTGKAKLTKGKFTWITEAGRQERWIVASCGAYTVLFNFRCGEPAGGRGRPPACMHAPRQRDASWTVPASGPAAVPEMVLWAEAQSPRNLVAVRAAAPMRRCNSGRCATGVGAAALGERSRTWEGV